MKGKIIHLPLSPDKMHYFTLSRIPHLITFLVFYIHLFSYILNLHSLPPFPHVPVHQRMNLLQFHNSTQVSVSTFIKPILIYSLFNLHQLLPKNILLWHELCVILLSQFNHWDIEGKDSILTSQSLNLAQFLVKSYS